MHKQLSLLGTHQLPKLIDSDLLTRSHDVDRFFVRRVGRHGHRRSVQVRLDWAMEVLEMFKVSPVAPFVRPRLITDAVFSDRPRLGSYQTLWSRGTGSGQNATALPLPIDVYSTNDEVVIVAAVPGMHPENFDISIHQGTVVLSGTVANTVNTEQGKSVTWYAKELWNGTFRRAVNLPFEVDADRATATWENGIVQLTLPRAEQARPRKIPLRVNGRTDAISAGDSSTTVEQ